MLAAILSNTNFLSVFAAAVAAWIFGAVYYGVLGKSWVAAQGKTMEAFKQAQAAKKGSLAAMTPFLLSFVAELVMAFVLFGILTHTGMFSVRAGMISGAFCWFGFVLTTVAVNNAFGGRRVMLTVIDAGHWLGVLLIVGAVLGAFGK
ncbi:MAG: DUF1761 domain-containing protein [Alphaproteobacteria bacterium]|nr:DUF1761 domain-containing protein [Alphaproteobacteria bacterium]